jgi:hypothetical protein
MSEHTHSALREYRKRIAAMLADTECTDDLLSLGIALLDFAILRIDRGERSWDHYAAKAWGGSSEYRLRRVLREDIRRYDAVKDANSNGPARQCGAPMVRRQGPCGQSAGRQALLTDADTGRKQWIAGCARHAEWFNAEVLANRAVTKDAPIAVRPPGNAGGVLARHIPEIDWEALWLKLDPTWTPPPEVEPEEIPVMPRLRLVLGGVSCR